MILLIDNYDSFTYNLAQLLGVEREIKIVRNDSETIFSLANQASAIVISPGPGTPKETGQVKEVIKQFYQKKPILGICLGHQTIGEVFGAKVSRAKEIRHGKQSLIKIHQNNQLFKEVDSGNLVMRYHSLIIEQETLPEDFLITATAADDQEIMAIEHREYPIFGLQFHPESIGTPSGAVIIKNFIQQTEVK
ncbi:anthranilate synthase component II [Enterococcus ureilyticus]|uniref:Anthranilate synthase component II n=1 Tax=Enterococcus ureilyticus TaxID=1131292 RepID=A0A1E5HES8_9ENTE|nr:aminodeoxychorismate/anthranilate synthase component II [Enterococcus ureilyticus]MBM7687397.1 anthranilate synthase component 2 [Enterococcus ureilyticus]OEG23451.1 anthranilate synthase component II [Enterococcus ureilyticus]